MLDNVRIGQKVYGALTNQFFGFVIAIGADFIRVSTDPKNVTSKNTMQIGGFSLLVICD